MDFQLLISTMRQDDFRLVQQMNIHSHALFINQDRPLDFTQTVCDGYEIEMLSFPERGIGLSRNTALNRADAKICLLADDDITYIDNYEEIILNEFKQHPAYDVILFNIESSNPARPEHLDTVPHNIHFFNVLKYGAFRIAFRRESIQKNRICFTQRFGGGSLYGSGEDTLFLIDCLKKGLKLYASAVLIGTVSHKTSTWFAGYNKKFFFDKGALFYWIAPFFSRILCLQFCLRHKEMLTQLSRKEAYQAMLEGVKQERKR